MWVLAPALLLAWASDAASGIEAHLREFANAYAVLEREAADPVDPSAAILGGAIPAMLRPLDPHSVFFDAEQFDQLRKMQESVSRGFGSVVNVLPGRVIVLQALPGTPSAKAGLSPGDEIIAINGILLSRLDAEQLVGLLTQSKQKPVSIDVRRPGSARLLPFVLTPEEMQNPSVERAFLLRPGTGYIKATSFDAKTGADIHQAIEKLGGSALKGLVLDLRGNPGGLLEAALETAALFLAPGQSLVTVRGRSIETSELRVPPSAEPFKFPLAVLVDGRSASAAEIVAGSLQDHDRAAIVGQPTFGKGLVETVYPLSEGAGLALTTAFYYTPSGRSIQRPLEAGQLSGVTSGSSGPRPEYRTDGGRIVKGGGGIQPDRLVIEEPPTRLQIFLEASGSFTNFATRYLAQHPAVSGDFAVTSAVFEEFRDFLRDRNVLPGPGEWSETRNWAAGRLKTEIFTQAFGVEKGDEVEAQLNIWIQTALKAL